MKTFAWRLGGASGRSNPGLAILVLFVVAFLSQMGNAQSNPDDWVQEVATIGRQKEKTASISFGDIDGDGDEDLVVANGRHWPGQNRVFINDGNGKFNRQRKLSDDQDTTYATPLADLDGDGDLDIVVGNDRQPNYVLLNNGKGNFSKSQQIGEPSSTRSITLADVDGKNGIDILVTNRKKPNLIFLNDGNGQFKTSKTFGEPSDSTIDVAVADMDRDGHNDLILANRDRQQNYVYFGDINGSFTRSVEYGSGVDETRGVAVVDFDQDGCLDILNANIGQPNVIYFGDGSGGFKRTVQFGGRENSYHLQCVPLQGKSKSMAIVVANVGTQNHVYVQKPDGSFHQSAFGIRRGATYSVAANNMDGTIEIATANSGETNRLFRFVVKPD